MAKWLAQSQFWSRYGIHPGAGRRQREGALRVTYRDPRGRQRPAGTFSNRRQADRAWQWAEGKVAQGYLGDPGRMMDILPEHVPEWVAHMKTGE
jgi:hypothetical protein